MNKSFLPEKISQEDRPFVFEQYKLLVSSLDSSNTVRETSTPYWVTVTGLGLGGISYVKEVATIPMEHKAIILWTLISVGMILCFGWINYLKALKGTIDVKNQLVEEMECYFPVKVFTAIFHSTGRHHNKGSLTERTMLIPILFLLGYIFFAVTLYFFTEEVTLPSH